MKKRTTIAVAGKGGTGKTTFAAIAASILAKRAEGPLLAVDADPNATLGRALGLKTTKTVADILEETKGLREVPVGLSKPQILEYQLQQCLTEGSNIDFLEMGRPEGAECYCAANHILREFIKQLLANYRYIVIDNEAGMEHLSRKTAEDIDVLVLVSDASVIGVRSACSVMKLVRSLKLAIDRSALVINRAPSVIPAPVLAEMDKSGLRLAGTVPHDEAITTLDLQDKPVTAVQTSSPAYTAVEGILRTLGVD
ncbi:MAG: AAA family ATPase [Planctomycetota bacterium]|nr:AAA family ATPase [Planctomycetota bacterium]